MRKSTQACKMIENLKLRDAFVSYIIHGNPVDIGEYPHQVGTKIM